MATPTPTILIRPRGIDGGIRFWWTASDPGLVESLRKGTMVKTMKHGYKPITMIGTSTIRNPAHAERIRERLYRYPKHELLLTGGPAVLVDSVNGEQMARIMSSYKGVYLD